MSAYGPGYCSPIGGLRSETAFEDFGVDEEYPGCARLDFEKPQNNEP
jgi:hypothetical protein